MIWWTINLAVYADSIFPVSLVAWLVATTTTTTDAFQPMKTQNLSLFHNKILKNITNPSPNIIMPSCLSPIWFRILYAFSLYFFYILLFYYVYIAISTRIVYLLQPLDANAHYSCFFLICVSSTLQKIRFTLRWKPSCCYWEAEFRILLMVLLTCERQNVISCCWPLSPISKKKNVGCSIIVRESLKPFAARYIWLRASVLWASQRIPPLPPTPEVESGASISDIRINIDSGRSREKKSRGGGGLQSSLHRKQEE